MTSYAIFRCRWRIFIFIFEVQQFFVEWNRGWVLGLNWKVRKVQELRRDSCKARMNQLHTQCQPYLLLQTTLLRASLQLELVVSCSFLLVCILILYMFCFALFCVALCVFVLLVSLFMSHPMHRKDELNLTKSKSSASAWWPSLFETRSCFL